MKGTIFGKSIHCVQTALEVFGDIWQIHSFKAILAGLLECHGKSLATESLQTLMAKCEAVLNSQPRTVQTISDVNS